ncbi:MAG: dephospho-CoA kinase [Candidatus Aerophobetes bacterium]|nr:dephospho-CoA kinase [Candidatus Aerophobetes bacterium]
MIIGVTGNIGCGKTTVAQMFSSLGAQVIEADRIGHLLLKRDEVKNKLVQIFGRSILNENGEIDRGILRRMVFTNGKKLEQLNLILHPLMAKEIKRRIQDSSNSLIILDAAVLFEARWNWLVDKVLVVTTSYDIQLKRIRENTDLSWEEIKGVMEAQLPQEEKVKRADFVIEDDGDLGKLRDEVKKLWENVNL